MSEDLIRSWIKKCKNLFECYKLDRRELEAEIRRVEKELKEKNNMSFPEEKSCIDRLFPHEFLFLLCNACDRLQLINGVPKPHLSAQVQSIKKYEMRDLESRRLDRIFAIE